MPTGKSVLPSAASKVPFLGCLASVNTPFSCPSVGPLSGSSTTSMRAVVRPIDRAHRIGQTRQVFAYRLVARDTVEEKILELQQSKRELADAIIQEDQSLIAKLTREDLELLLS